MNRRSFFMVAAGAALAKHVPVKLPVRPTGGQYLYTCNLTVAAPRYHKQLVGFTGITFENNTIVTDRYAPEAVDVVAIAKKWYRA